MRKLLLFSVLATLTLCLAAQPARPQGGRPGGMGGFFGPRVDTVKIWPNGAPNAFPPQKSSNGQDYSEAIMEVYPARNPNGHCVIVCPGGGYAMLSLTHEARDFHTWFNNRGITFCVLQYRLPRGHHDVPLLHWFQGRHGKKAYRRSADPILRHRDRKAPQILRLEEFHRSIPYT